MHHARTLAGRRRDAEHTVMKVSQIASLHLVDAVLATHPLVKSVGRELARRPPDAAVAARIERAYRSHEAPAWLAAYLLGCTRHPRSYALVLELLEELDPSPRTVEYAAPALVKIDPRAGIPRLFELLRTASRLSLREAAARTLAQTDARERAETILQAGLARHIRAETAGACLASCALDDAIVLQLLGSMNETPRRIATALLAHDLARIDASTSIRAALLDLLCDPDYRMRPTRRESLRARATAAAPFLR